MNQSPQDVSWADTPMDHEVHIWRVSLDVAADGFVDWLSPEEEARRSSLAAAVHRDWFAVAHGTKRRILGWYLSLPPERVPFETGRWGKPRVAGDAVRFSLSHCGSDALLAISRHRDVGVDIEHPRPGLDPQEFAARHFRPEESRYVASAVSARRWTSFLALWTRKEACVKAAGARLSQGFSLPVGRGARHVSATSGPMVGHWRVDDVPVRPDCRSAVALIGPAPFRTVCYTWDAAALTEDRT